MAEPTNEEWEGALTFLGLLILSFVFGLIVGKYVWH